jgi:lysophospholipase L1-like esterase
LRNEIKLVLRCIPEKCLRLKLYGPKYYHVFSWHYSDNFQALEKSRHRLNNCIVSCVLKSGGCYIRYPDLKHPVIFKDDGVHFTKLGNELLLNNIQGAIEAFNRHLNMSITFPDQ